MTAAGFLTFLKHFVAHVRPSPTDKVILLLDNHVSHSSVDVLQFAKDNGVFMVSFPPHCSHKLQPLDRSVYGPLKRYYNVACDDWIVSHKGRTMTIYDVPAMVGLAYPKAMTPANIQAGFKVSGISPFNRNVFTDDEFLPADVTDRPPPPEQEATGVRDVPTLGDAAGVRDAPTLGDAAGVRDAPTLGDAAGVRDAPTIGDAAGVRDAPTLGESPCRKQPRTPEDVRPFTKAPPRKTNQRGKKRGRSMILKPGVHYTTFVASGVVPTANSRRAYAHTIRLRATGPLTLCNKSWL